MESILPQVDNTLHVDIGDPDYLSVIWEQTAGPSGIIY